MSIVRLLAVVGIGAMMVGCKPNLPPPANHDFLTRCHYTFYKSFHEAGPSGVMVDMRQGNKTCHMILMAAHVVDEVYKRAKVNKNYGIGFRKQSDINIVRRIEGGLNMMMPFKHPDYSAEDIGLFTIPDVSGIVANEGSVCSINLDKPFVGGVGVIRERGDYARYGIHAGSEVFALCSDLSKALSNNEYDWTCQTIERKGTIVDLEAKIPTQTPGVSQRAVVVDFPSKNGNSGGPVFARSKVDGVEYPILIGVVSGRSDDNRFTYVAPVDSLLRIVREQLDHPADVSAMSDKSSPSHVAKPCGHTKPKPTDNTLTEFKVDQLPCRTSLPRTPAVYDVVCETVAYAAVPVLTLGVKEIALEIAVDGVASNALRVAFAADANRNGKMEMEEFRVQFGWDAGGWMARDAAWEFDLETPPVPDGRHTMRWVWTLDGNGKTTDFKCEADGQEIFAELKAKLPALSVQPDWNLIQIKRNGVTDPNESIVMTYK